MIFNLLLTLICVVFTQAQNCTIPSPPTLAFFTEVSSGNCTELIGNFTISGSSITMTQLMVLSNISAVHGNVHISGTPYQNLGFLSSLQTVDGNFMISNNDELVSLAGLEHLKTVSGLLALSNLVNLSNVNGLISLTSVGHLTVEHVGISTVDAFRNLDMISGALVIVNNAHLTNIYGLLNATVNGSVYIVNNTAFVCNDMCNNNLIYNMRVSLNQANISQCYVDSYIPCSTTEVASSGASCDDASSCLVCKTQCDVTSSPVDATSDSTPTNTNGACTEGECNNGKCDADFNLCVCEWPYAPPFCNTVYSADYILCVEFPQLFGFINTADCTRYKFNGEVNMVINEDVELPYGHSIIVPKGNLTVTAHITLHVHETVVPIQVWNGKLFPGEGTLLILVDSDDVPNVDDGAVGLDTISYGLLDECIFKDVKVEKVEADDCYSLSRNYTGYKLVTVFEAEECEDSLSGASTIFAPLAVVLLVAKLF